MLANFDKPEKNGMAARQSLTDEEVVARVLAGDVASFEILMRRHNQRLYRIGRAILRNDSEAEDVMQEAYVNAYQHLGQFAGRAKFSTWLSRIAVNEALARRRSLGKEEELGTVTDENGNEMERFSSPAPSPEKQASSAEMNRLLEAAIESLPDAYRAIIVLRDLEEMDTAEAAEVLAISEENVKTRLHRARALLRKRLYLRVGEHRQEAFAFHDVRCDRVVKKVFERIGNESL
jgi:RNA polymerase sigma-70 factor (ECF subfamily)